MKNFKYQGPVSKLTFLQDDKLEGVMLFPGAQLQLPEDDEQVALLVHRGHLTEVEAVEAEAPPAAGTDVPPAPSGAAGDAQLAAEAAREAQEDSSEARAPRRGRKTEEQG